jgi:hypothetical protein
MQLGVPMQQQHVLRKLRLSLFWLGRLGRG